MYGLDRATLSVISAFLFIFLYLLMISKRFSFPLLLFPPLPPPPSLEGGYI